MIEKTVKKVSKRNKVKQFFYVFLFVLIDLFVVFNVSNIFSSIIIHQKSFFEDTKVEYNSFSFYCVSLKHFLVEDEANKYANEVSKKGAMGSVFHNGEYYVFANIYPNLIEAQEIKENLIELGYDARIVKFSVPSILLNLKNGKNRQIVVDCLDFLREEAINLCNLCIEFDNKDIKRATANGKIASIIGKANDLLSEVAERQTKGEENVLAVLKNNLEMFCINFERVVLTQDNFEMFSCAIKKGIYDMVVHLKDSFIDV